MGVLHGLLVAGVIGLIAVAPCLVCVLLMSADEVLSRGWETVLRRMPRTVRERVERRRARNAAAQRRGLGLPEATGGARGGKGGRRKERWERWRLGRELGGLGGGVKHGRVRADCPPIEQVAGDLRRLNRLREGVAMRSRVWFVAVQEAYDEGLRVACVQLGVEQHLGEVHGVDLELERLRVEGELQRAGLVLRDAGAQQR